ncbi:MAG: Uma2 family endonuclease, partial [Chloroflexota bacterium]
VEVSFSSASYDLGPKKQAYLRNGVREYVVFRVDDEAVDWFRLHDGAYHRLVPSAGGVLESVVFPGLWLDTAALVAGRLDQLLDVLDQGLRSAEHAAFVAHLGTPASR